MAEEDLIEIFCKNVTFCYKEKSMILDANVGKERGAVNMWVDEAYILV